MKYKAFISYKHGDCTKQANVLQRALKKYAKPLFAKPIKIFWDEEYIVPVVDLPVTIKRALDESEYLIYFASKKAAQSSWVQDEIKYWCESLQRKDRLIIVHIKDDIKLNLKYKKLDWEGTNALPKLLKNYVKSIPFYVDLRWAQKDEDFVLSNAEFKKIVRNITARLRNITPNEMDGEEVKIYRRNRRVRNSATLLLIILTILASGFAWYAIKKQEEAEIAKVNEENEKIRALKSEQRAIAQTKEAQKQKKEAVEQKKIAETRQKEIEKKKKELQIQLEETNHNLGLFFLSKAKSALQEKDFNKLRLYSMYALRNLKKNSSKEINTVHNYLLKRDYPLISSVFCPGNRHGCANYVCFSPDGRILASESDKHIKLWDIETGKELASFKAHSGNPKKAYSGAIAMVIFSPDGKKLASCGTFEDSTIKIWNLETKKQIMTLRNTKNKKNSYKDSVFCIDFSPDGKRLASGNFDKTIDLWSIETGEKIVTLTGHSKGVLMIAFSPNGELIASGSSDGLTKVWDIKKNREVLNLTGHSGEIHDVKFSPDGKILASASKDNTIKLWDIKKGKEISTLIGHSRAVIRIAFSPDGELLASGSMDCTIRLWDIATAKTWAVIHGHSEFVSGVCFSPDGKILASGSADETRKLWDIRNSEEFVGINEEFAPVQIEYSMDGRILAMGIGKNNTLRVRDIETGRDLATFKMPDDADNLRSLNFSPLGKIVVIGTENKTISLWHIDSGKLFLTIKGFLRNFRCFDISPDGKRLVSISTNYDDYAPRSSSFEEVSISPTGTYRYSYQKGEIQQGWGYSKKQKTNILNLWDTQTGKKVSSLKVVSNEIKYGKFSPDGNKIVTVSEVDSLVKLWNIKTWKEIYTFKGDLKEVKEICFSSNGKRLALAGDDIEVYNTENGKKIFTLDCGSNSIGSLSFSSEGKLPYSNIRLSSNGKILALGTAVNTIKLWNLGKSKKLVPFEKNDQGVLGITLFPDGKKLIANSGKDGILLMDLSFLYEPVPTKKQIEEESYRKYSLTLENLELVPIKRTKLRTLSEKKSIYSQWSKSHPFYWLNKAQKGDSKAMVSLGMLYERDNEFEKAIYWYKKSSDKGNSRGEKNLQLLKKWLNINKM
ncbi:TIR domain-containing protein [Acidobacteriota bacterium]